MEEKEINNPAPEEMVENGAETAPEVENEPLSELDQTKADLVEQNLTILSVELPKNAWS
jgi:hypothetical protein